MSTFKLSLPGSPAAAGPSVTVEPLFHGILLLIIGAFFLMGTAGCDKGEETTLSAPINIAAGYWPGTYWVDVANRKDWFREAGLDATIINTNPDYFGSFEKLLNGQLDCHQLPFFDFVRLNAEGHDLTGVFITDYAQGAEAIVARPGIDSIQDLRGKRLGVTFDTYGEHVIALVAARDALPLDEVELVDLVGETAHEDFIAGKVDAVFVWVPLIQPALDGVPGSKVLFSSAEMPGVNGGIECFRREFVEERPDDVRKVVKVWQRATAFIRDHPEEAYKIVSEVNNIPVDDVRAFTEVDRPLNRRDNEFAFSFASGVDSIHGNFRRINDFILERNPDARKVDTAEVLDGTFIRELKQE